MSGLRDMNCLGRTVISRRGQHEESCESVEEFELTWNGAAMARSVTGSEHSWGPLTMKRNVGGGERHYGWGNRIYHRF
jgi:hypothetical protein